MEFSVNHAKCDWYQIGITQHLYIAREYWDYFGGKASLMSMLGERVLVKCRDEPTAVYHFARLHATEDKIHFFCAKGGTE